MRTLYVRVFLMTILIVIIGGFLGFIATNLYYHNYLKSGNDEKILHIAEKTVEILEESNHSEANYYLDSIKELGYQFYLIDQKGTEHNFGPKFRAYNLSEEQINRVLNGEVYRGIRNFPWNIFITGFFNSELRNTIGMPLEWNGEKAALFIRPNTVQQFGEMRYFIAIFLGFTLWLSFLLLLISTRFIVNPIKELTAATKKIAAGNYHLKLKTNRKDEIGRLAQNFMKMSENLQETEKVRQQFVSNVSHEIQSPLTSIRGFSETLRNDDLSKEDRDRYLSIIEKESSRLSVLSNQLLTLSFLDSEIDRDQKAAFDLHEQLKDVISTTEWQWREKDITIKLESYPIILFGEPSLMHQVWMNLFTNAIHYTNNGGTITIQTKKKNNKAQIIFQDTGVGIAEENLTYLFDRFYIVDKARTRTDSSTGLGLSIVKKIIELHDGTIMVESELGKGSTFVVSLPI